MKTTATNSKLSPRELVLDILGQLDLPKDQYVLAGSGILAIRDLRAPGDLDIFTTTRLWFELLNQFDNSSRPDNIWQVFTTDPSDDLRKSDPAYLYRNINDVEINVFYSWRLRNKGNINVAELLNSTEMVEGIPCQPLQSLHNWKSQIRREKDIPDLSLIQKQILIENGPPVLCEICGSTTRTRCGRLGCV